MKPVAGPRKLRRSDSSASGWLPAEGEAEGVGGDPGQFRVREPEDALRDFELARQRGAEHGRVVGVEDDRHAGLEQAAHGVIFDALHGSGGEVARKTDLERDPVVAEVLEKRGILRRRDPMANALGADLERLPDGSRAGGFAGVRRQAESRAAGPGEQVAEKRRRTARLVASDAERHHAVADAFGGHGGDAAGVLHCLRPDGTVLWKYQGDGTGIACSPAITDSGDVIYGTTAGQLRRLTRSPIVIPYVPGASAAMIDGVLSPGEWDGALAIPLEATSPLTNPGWNPLDGDAVYPADCSAVVYVMHDGENLYVGFDITDDDICADWQVTHSPVNCAVWNDDCTEVFIDGDLDRDNTEAAAGSPAGDRDWREGCVPHFGIYNNAYFNKSQYDNIDRYGSEWWAATTTQTQKIYTEYKFAFSGIDTVDGENGYAPIRPGALFGFNALLNDDDGDGDREDQIALHGGDTLNTCYKTQHDWAPALLAPLDSPTPTPTPTPSMTPAPTPTSTPAPDAEKIRRYLLRMDHDPSGLDVNGDNRIDVSDLIYVLSRR